MHSPSGRYWTIMFRLILDIEITPNENKKQGGLYDPLLG